MKKVKIILIALGIFISVNILMISCSDSMSEDSNSVTNSAFASFSGADSRINGTLSSRLSSCSQTSSYTVKLKTTGGVDISPSAVAPNTQYSIHITYSGTYPGSTNVAYCTVLAYGFTTRCNDATNGSTVITITTNSVLPPFGIIGVVGPTDCSGSLASAQGSTSTQKEVV